MFKNFFKIVLVLIFMPSSVLYADHTILEATKSITDNNQFPQNKINVIKNDEENEEYEIAKQHEKEFNYRNWIRAMEQKEKMPSYIKKDINYDPGLNSILEISSKSNGAFFPTNQKKSSKDVIVHSAKNPLPNSSFGFIGVFANVESIKSDKIDGTLVLKINPLRLGTVDRNSLKVFYWDKAAKKFIKTRYSGIGHDNGGNYVWAHVTKPGVYAIIGRNTDPRVTSFIKIVDGVKIVINNENVTLLKIKKQEAVPTTYNLEQNYPNPFNPATTIKFSIPEATNVTLTIYNALGEKITELVNTKLEAGRYNYQWDANNAASGMYIYELRTEKFVSVKKMVYNVPFPLLFLYRLPDR